MGEASRRGTFEERKAAAIERDENEDRLRKKILANAREANMKFNKSRFATILGVAMAAEAEDKK